MEKVKELFPDRPDMWRFYQQMFENLVKDSSLTIEKAVLATLQQFGLSVSLEMLKMLLNRSVYVDWAIRMYHRGRVVTALAEAGLEIYLLGPGWEDHPAAGRSNVHLEQLPGLAGQLLADPDRAETIIQKGYEKVRQELTWSNCAEWLLSTVDQVRGKRG